MSEDKGRDALDSHQGPTGVAYNAAGPGLPTPRWDWVCLRGPPGVGCQGASFSTPFEAVFKPLALQASRPLPPQPTLGLDGTLVLAQHSRPSLGLRSLCPTSPTAVSQCPKTDVSRAERGPLHCPPGPCPWRRATLLACARLPRLRS